MPITAADSGPATTETTPPQAKSRLRPRRTLNRLALALGGVAAGIVGQHFFDQDSLWDGLLLYGVAVVLFVRALADHPYPNVEFSIPNPQLNNTLTVCQNWRRNVGVWLMLLAVGFSFLGYNFFERGDARMQAWWLYLAGLGLFIVGGMLLTPGRSLRAEAGHMLPNRQIAIGLSIVLGLALFMRLYNFGEQPFGIWFDEAEAGLQARQMLQDITYRPIFYPTINVTGHLLATYALALRWLGDNIYSIRLVSVFFGLGGVLAAYLFGRELREPRFGLALAFLVAVARWHVNFSRIAMTGIDAPFFEFLSLFFLTRLLRRGRLRDALWAGLTLGFGMMFYTAFRLYALALVIFVAVVAIRWSPYLWAALRHNAWRRYLGAAAIMLVTGWLVVMPIVQYARNDPDSFWYRTRQISIFTKRDQANLSTALWESTRQHLLMFHYLGDRNGRHNLPGEPMLDPAMGILAILGLGLALARTRYPANAFFLILFPTALVGGIFSVDFEAPQSLRSIAVIPAVIYFVGLALVALGKEAKEALHPLPKVWLIAPAALVAGYMFAFNAYTYFYRQANDFASWNAFSAPETITGRKMAQLGTDYEYVLSPFLTNHPTTRFLAPDIARQFYLNVPDALPIRIPSNRPVAMFIHPDDSWVFDEAKRFYPNAKYEILSGPADDSDNTGPPSVYFVGLRPDDIAAIRGLELQYWPAATPGQTEQFPAPQHSSRASNVNVTWPQDSPIEGDFVAEWNGVLYAPTYGAHSFRLITPGPGLLEIDGNILLEGRGEQLTGLPLAQGNHRIRIRAESAPGQVALYWQPPNQGEELAPAWALYSPPVSNHGLQGTFYANNNWEGQPAFQRIDPFLDIYFHLIPLNRPYTVEWAGSLIAPQSGVYRLGLRVVQEGQLYLDGELLLTSIGPNQFTEAPVTLAAGLHDILIRYRDSVDRSRVHLTWTPPSGVFEAIPREYLWPPMGSYPIKPAPTEDTAEILPLALKEITSLGSPGAQAGQFFDPRDVAVLSNGNLAVADTGNKRVQIFDPQLNYLQELTGDDLPFEEPVAVAVNSQDQILVLDSTLQWVYRYQANGKLIDRLGGPSARLFHPRGLTVFEDDSLVVADTGMARLVFYNHNGDQIGNISGLGNGPGQLNEPIDVLRDAQGAYFVAEAENNRVQRLDAAGNPLIQWAIPPTYAYDGPHLAFGPDGSILMTESQSNSLLRYAPTGILIDQWHTIDSVTLLRPVGIYFDASTNRLYVTDVATHQVHIFEALTTTGENSEDD